MKYLSVINIDASNVIAKRIYNLTILFLLVKAEKLPRKTFRLFVNLVI